MKPLWILLTVVALIVGGWFLLAGPSETGGGGSGWGGGGSGGGGWGGGGGGRAPAVVSTAPVREGEYFAQAELVGTLTANATAPLYAKVPGQITALYANTGDPVEAGQVLAEIESDTQRKRVDQAQAALAMRRATLTERRAALGMAEATARRTRSLAEQQLVPEQQLDTVEAELEGARAQVELARAQVTEAEAALAAADVELEQTHIRAPFDGVVGKRYLDVGARAGANDTIFTVVDLSPIKTTVDLTARDAARVRPGQAATLETESFPERTFEGRVARLASIYDPETHTTEAEIEVDNLEGFLKPGMFATVGITFDEAAQALLVPQSAVVEDERAPYVMVAEKAADTSQGPPGAERSPDGGPREGGPPTFRARRVTVETLGVGRNAPSTVAVAPVEGDLEAGQQVITLGQGDLADGALVVPSSNDSGRPGGGGPSATAAPAD